MPPGAPLGLAVSGGADSLALLLLAHRDGRWPLAVATVDHGLREAAADEAADVLRLCVELDVPHDTLTPDRPIGPANRQAGARTARLTALARWAAGRGLSAVATGHQMDDRAETLALRLMRGSGLHGLSGMRPVLCFRGADAPPMQLVRPLLGCRRAELAALVHDAGLVPVDDPSNHDPAHDRARLRQTLPPELVPRLARSAAALEQAAEALCWAEDRAADRALSPTPDGLCLDSAGLPDALRRALLARSVARLRPSVAPPTGPELDRLLATLHEGDSATLRGIVFRGGTVWTIALAPPPRAPLIVSKAARPISEPRPFDRMSP